MPMSMADLEEKNEPEKEIPVNETIEPDHLKEREAPITIAWEFDQI